MRVAACWTIRALAAVALIPAMSGCTYFKHVQRQSQLTERYNAEPNLRELRHLLEQERHTVYGRLIEPERPLGPPAPMAVAAFSSALQKDELVDVGHLAPGGTYYALTLPAGRYRLVAVRDRNDNGQFENDEAVAVRLIEVGLGSPSLRVERLADLVQEPQAPQSLPGLPLQAMAGTPDGASSVFYPPGTIRDLDDPIFSASMSELGLYDPAAFAEIAPLMFYALEEDLGHKIPVVFVHGIGGSARNFASLVARLDRRRFRPWFFHYPSGTDLRQSAQILHDVFLSGQVIPRPDQPMVIVAHSMGGLVAREALNLLDGSAQNPDLRMLITLATPFGGMASAGVGVRRAPLVVPAWRDLDPLGEFIANLHRHPRPTALEHHALYASKRLRAPLPPDRGSDGVVPIHSQLAPMALAEFTSLQGVETDHMGILESEQATAHILALLEALPQQFEEGHRVFIEAGGFDVRLADSAGPLGDYLIRHYGRYLRALAQGVIPPASPEQVQFVAAARGETPARAPGERAWRALMREFPELAEDDLPAAPPHAD